MNAPLDIGWTGADSTEDATCSRVSPERAASRAQVSGWLMYAITSCSTVSAYAATMGVSRTTVGRWCCAESGAAITLGDLLAGRRDVARAVLVRALDALDDGAVRVDLAEAVLRLVGDVGRLAGALGDRERERCGSSTSSRGDALGSGRR